MLNPGTKVEDFTAAAMVNGDKGSVSWKDFDGKWRVVVFYPFDFTGVCGSELVAFNEQIAEFERRGVAVLGASCDSIFSHIAWAKELGGVKFPVIGDVTRKVARAFDVLAEDKGCAHRAAYICDPQGVVKAVLCNDLPIGRSTEEVLRLIDAFQTGQACPVNWKK